jgi:hypothetical protein
MIDKAHSALRRLLPIRLGKFRHPPATVADVDLDRLLARIAHTFGAPPDTVAKV